MSVYLRTDHTSETHFSQECSKSELLHLLDIQHECRLFGCEHAETEREEALREECAAELRNLARKPADDPMERAHQEVLAELRELARKA